ncbi:hypothetical protein JEU57_20905 [Pseudomonas aeruginosa]|nr:hypothetical protein [Pseudomonas aeruginosa]MBI7287638.1 hypothetical protein [Pseudomonas aeruginosa]MBI7305252.1 hypothetical protein [Pseudomonas aeruginosa]HEK3495178.1 hypothetical protein [Pseudomonas aeruginosa]HEK3627978.1 hypothetical protein [Pseudomonas aeruginosa]
MSYSAKSFSALINAMRADGITRLEQLARQPFRNAQASGARRRRNESPARPPYRSHLDALRRNHRLAGLLRSLTGRPPAPRPAVPRRSGVPPFSGEIPSFRRQHRQARPAQTFHPFAVKKTLSKKLIAACQYANALA